MKNITDALRGRLGWALALFLTLSGGVMAGTTNLDALTVRGTVKLKAITWQSSPTFAVPSPVAGGLLYSGAANMATGAAGSSGQIVRSGGTGAPTWSTATYPATASTAGKVLTSDGTNFVASLTPGPLTSINLTAGADLASNAACTAGTLTASATHLYYCVSTGVVLRFAGTGGY